jgi:2-polyprenyl-6-methoxyphenol hydroxylase-like FAD-dependent oxidoreductase
MGVALHHHVARGVPHDRLAPGDEGDSGMSNERLQPIEIIGGGLAGLSLGVALRRAGVPVTVFEAHGYPRHRVCGEFLTGLDESTTTRLGLAPLLEDALRHHLVVWYQRDRPMRTQHLPAPALGLSRHALDARLAEAFVTAGGELRTDTRVPIEAAPAGRVFATGRLRHPSPWIGLKVHACNLRLAGDLEVHLGDQAYVGLSGVEDGRINVCGLFRRRPAPPDEPVRPGAGLLLHYLDSSGLGGLAGRLRAAEIDETSFCAVAAMSFQHERPRPDRLQLGDSFAMPPPFTGNGMAMALQSAALALEPLLAWTRGERSWPASVATVNRRLHRRFRTRLASAYALHPFLLEPRRQRWLALAGRARLLPLRPFYHLTH